MCLHFEHKDRISRALYVMMFACVAFASRYVHLKSHLHYLLQQTQEIGLIADVFYLNVLETCRLERNVVSCNIACIAILIGYMIYQRGILMLDRYQ